MLTKNEVVKTLSGHGFTAWIENNVIYVSNAEISMDRLAQLMKRIGYCGSYGVKAVQKGAE